MDGLNLTDKQMDALSAKVAEKIAGPLVARVQVVVDEKVNETRAHVDAKVKEVAAGAERRGINVNPAALDNPNLARWVNNQGAGPLGLAAPISVAGRTGRMTIREALEAQVPSVMFAGNPNFRAWASVAGTERTSPRVTVGNLFSHSRAAGVTSVSDIQAVLSTILDQEITILPQRQIRTRDLFSVVPTDKQQTLYIRQTGYANNAGTQPLNQNDPMTATAAPQSTLAYTEETAVAKLISHWIPCPRSFMLDIPSLVNAVETQGKLGVLLKEDTQLISGSGAGNDIPGVLNDPNISGALAWSQCPSGSNMADALLVAMALQWITNYEPDGVVLHPYDWMLIATMKNTLGNYLLPTSFLHDVMGPLDSPQPMETLQVWGMNTVRTTAMNTGTNTLTVGGVTYNGFGQALIGAFKTAATVYDLETVEMQVFDQHADFALKMLNVLFFYERLALANKRPEAFRPVTFDNAPA